MSKLKQSGRPLTATFVRTVKRPGRYGDGRGGHGLSLLVKPMRNGRISKTWSQRVRINGRPTYRGLGPYPLVSLAEARKLALENARELRAGRDPWAAARVPTFEQAAERVIGIHARSWKQGTRTERDWRATLTTYAFPVIGSKRVDKITTADVLRVVGPIWSEKPATAQRLRRRISVILAWCVAQGHRTDDPAGATVLAALPKISGPRNHHRALPHTEMPEAVAEIRRVRARPITRLVAEFVILTACRSGEVRSARWSEIDPDGRVWAIPADRMKGGREHRVPLGRAALAVLDKAAQYSDGSGYVFPNRSGRPLTTEALRMIFRNAGLKTTVHGFRTSFRTWAAETGADRTVSELCLAHRVGSATELAYQRSDLFQMRADLMEAWGKYVTG